MSNMSFIKKDLEPYKISYNLLWNPITIKSSWWPHSRTIQLKERKKLYNKINYKINFSTHPSSNPSGRKHQVNSIKIACIFNLKQWQIYHLC